MNCRRYRRRVLRQGPRPRGSSGRRASTTLPTQCYVTAASRPLQYLTTARNHPELQQSRRPDLTSRVPAAAERTSCSAAARQRGTRSSREQLAAERLSLRCCTAASVKHASLCTGTKDIIITEQRMDRWAGIQHTGSVGEAHYPSHARESRGLCSALSWRTCSGTHTLLGRRKSYKRLWNSQRIPLPGRRQSLNLNWAQKRCKERLLHGTYAFRTQL